MRRKSKRTPCSIKNNDVLLFNPVKIAENFNFFFTNIGPNIAKRIPKGRKSPMTYLNDEIVKIIKSFSNNKSAGPNSLPTPILKNCADVLSFPISYLVNLSFTTGEFPNLCNIAKVIPLFKKGDPLDCSNYRPISLLSSFSKIFEKFVYKRVCSFLEKNNLIFKRQFGFRSGCSSNHAIVNLVESIKKYNVCSVFIDLEKAFDTVDHQMLLKKVDHYGIRGLAHNWFQSYLFYRQQFIFISGSSSELMSIKCGVPQGSALRSLLLLLCISDLNSVFNKTIAIHFADDTRLSYTSKKLSAIESVMNCELKTLTEWLRSNKLSLNSGKSELVLFSSKTMKDLHEITIKINKSQLSPVPIFKKYL